MLEGLYPHLGNKGVALEASLILEDGKSYHLSGELCSFSISGSRMKTAVSVCGAYFDYWEERISIEELLLSDWPMDMSVGNFLGC